MNTFSKVTFTLQGTLFLAKLAESVDPADFGRISKVETFHQMDPDDFKIILPKHHSKWRTANPAERVKFLDEGFKVFLRKQKGAGSQFVQDRKDGTGPVPRMDEEKALRFIKKLKKQNLQNLMPEVRDKLKQKGVNSATRSGPASARAASRQSPAPKPAPARGTPSSRASDAPAPAAPSSRPSASSDHNLDALSLGDSAGVYERKQKNMRDALNLRALEVDIMQMRNELFDEHNQLRQQRRSLLLKKFAFRFSCYFGVRDGTFHTLNKAVQAVALDNPRTFDAITFLRMALHNLGLAKGQPKTRYWNAIRCLNALESLKLYDQIFHQSVVEEAKMTESYKE